MPYREKTAWLALVAMALTFGPYFVLVAAEVFPQRADYNPPMIIGYAITTMVQVAILGAGTLYLRRAAPDDARMPPDERDTEIMRRSLSLAYYMLIGGMILVGCIMPFSAGGWEVANAAIFMIVAAEVLHYSVVIVSYRRQA